jgi:hypothetical protein
VAGELPWDDLLKVDAGSWFSREFKGEPLPLHSRPQLPCRQGHHVAGLRPKASGRFNFDIRHHAVTSNGWGVAGELPWDDLLKVDAGSWFSREFKGEPLPPGRAAAAARP